MKHLLLLRHAKSSWESADLSDHQRPLNERGKRDAPRMGHWICQQELQPDLVISSTAMRAEQTARAVASECGCEDLVELTDELYHAPPARYLSILAELPVQVQRVLMVGHNPGIESLVGYLSGEPAQMPTAALAHLELSIDCWQQFDSAEDASLAGFWIPRELD